MSPLVARPGSLRQILRDERHTRAVLPPPRPRAWLEPALVFAVAYTAYASAGIALVWGADVVVGDAQSRLAHAYFVWWNEPSKLTAIGFYWPPLQTLVLLPLAIFPPLANSLVALPLTSALFGAGLLSVVDRAFTWAGVSRAPRLAIVAAFGLNPIYAFYAANGMGEILYLALLTLAVWIFIRWSSAPRWFDLLVVGVALALGTLARYEVALYAVPIAVVVVLVHLRRRDAVSQIEASLLALTVPIVYGLLLWAYINSTIVGDPFAFFRAGVPSLPPDPAFDSPFRLLVNAVSVNASIFPLTLLVAAIVLAVVTRRRDVVGLALATLLLLNVLTTFALMLAARQGYLLELRYNMRSLPLTMLACAWLLAQAKPGRRQLAASALAFVLLLTIPLTGWTMLRHDRVLDKRISTDVTRVRPVSRSDDFIRVMRGRSSLADAALPRVDLASERAMAAYIRRHVDGVNAILTDDSRTFGVMLADGDPSRYLDRIDFGERHWLDVLRRPVGKVRYVLLSDRAYDLDRVVVEYPIIAAGGSPPFLRLVHRVGSFRLYEVVDT